jgi:hypothetical protein
MSSARVRGGLGVVFVLLASGCCGLGKAPPEVVARRQRCQGQGLPLGDGKCHSCPAGTRLKEEIRTFQKEKDDWPLEMSIRMLSNDTGHGSIGSGRGSGRGSGGPIFSETDYEDRAFCEDGGGKRQGPFGKWVLGSKSSKEAPALVDWGTYKDGLRHGAWSEEHGYARGSYEAGKRQGRWVLGDGWGEYKAGVRDGSWKYLGSEGTFRGGKRVGPWQIKSSFSVGSLHEGVLSGRFEEGKPVGPFVVRYPDGECSGVLGLAEGVTENLVGTGLWLCKDKVGPGLARCMDAKGTVLWEDFENKQRGCPK